MSGSSGALGSPTVELSGVPDRDCVSGADPGINPQKPGINRHLRPVLRSESQETITNKPADDREPERPAVCRKQPDPLFPERDNLSVCWFRGIAGKRDADYGSGL